MKLLLTGASGFIGEAVVLKLMKAGHTLVLLSRTPAKLEKKYGPIHSYYAWDSLSETPPKQAFAGIDAIINLMGENVANKRWSKQQKQKIRHSRVIGTKKLLDAARTYAKQCLVCVSASAIGYYDHSQPGILDENSPASQGFLGQLCQDWEKATEHTKDHNSMRTVIIRIGIVLEYNGGALSKMITPFSLGLGGQLGSGKQWMNWIHREDLATLIVESVENQHYEGVYNAVSPNNVQNKIFTKTLGHLLGRPTLFRLPCAAIRLIFGEFSQELLQGQQVISKRLEKAGFKFQYPTLTVALEHILGLRFFHHLGKTLRCCRFHSHQYLDYPPEIVFRFFSNAQNLEKITPRALDFRVLSQSTDNIETGTIFNYQLSIKGIPMRWCSLITDWKPGKSFTDIQLKGPYKLWHHTHKFSSYLKGTLIEDELYYALPKIPFFNLLSQWLVKRDIHHVFAFRKQEIHHLLRTLK